MKTVNHLILVTAGLFVMSSCTKTPSACYSADKGKAAKVNEEVQFDASCSQDATTYTWDFGDGGTDSGLNVKHKYLNTGVYTVTLKASNKKKSETMTETITIS